MPVKRRTRKRKASAAGIAVEVEPALPPKAKKAKKDRYKRQARESVRDYIFLRRPIRISQDDAYLQFKITLHARRFSRVNELKWDPKDKYDLVPPKKDLTNENLEDFFTDVFESTGKPSVQQGKKWVNHVLAKHHLPPVNKFNCGEQTFKIKSKVICEEKYFASVLNLNLFFREEHQNKNANKIFMWGAFLFF